jgi:hypothetical protein
MIHSPRPPFQAHETALRYMASESRFGRRIIAHELYDILREPDQQTFWAATVASKDVTGVRYVWLTYPKRPANVSLEDIERFLMTYLQKHIHVARSIFPADVLIGIALPNPGAEMNSHMIAILDGTKWSTADQAEADRLRKDERIFEHLQAVERTHLP